MSVDFALNLLRHVNLHNTSDVYHLVFHVIARRGLFMHNVICLLAIAANAPEHADLVGFQWITADLFAVSSEILAFILRVKRNTVNKNF
jgi:hypothetical protein